MEEKIKKILDIHKKKQEEIVELDSVIYKELKNIERKYNTEDIYNFLDIFGEEHEIERTRIIEGSSLTFYSHRKGIEIKDPCHLYLFCDYAPFVKLYEGGGDIPLIKEKSRTPINFCYLLFAKEKIELGKITESFEKEFEKLINKVEVAQKNG